MRLPNKVAIITGAGSGMGRAAALLFAQEGAKVVVADINGKAAQETVDLIKKDGKEALSVEVDVSKAPDVARMVKTALDKYGKLDILYNNAGYPMLPTPVEDIEEELWDKIMAVNVKGIFLAAKYAFPVMKKQGGGNMIITASISGKRPRPGQAPYSTSKAAAIFLTKALAIEAAPHKIRVNCVNPTATETPMIPQLGATTPDAVKGIVSTIPLGRMAQPIDIAYAALYLASDEASLVTGISLDVDGGRGV